MDMEKLLYNEIGKNIKKRRKELKITQEHLADLTHFSDSFIANIESNTYQTFSLTSLNIIANALNCNIADLLPNKKFLPENNNLLICGYCKYTMEIPVELSNLLREIEDISNNKLILTCPKCGRKKM